MIIVRIFSLIAPFLCANLTEIYSEPSPLRADTSQSLTLSKRVSAFAPIRKKVWEKKWKENLATDAKLQLPEDFPFSFRAKHAWKAHSLREFLSQKDRYERIQSENGPIFRGNSNTVFREVRFNDSGRSATFRGHDSFLCHENYFKAGPGSFRPLRKVIVYSYRQNDQRLTLNWEIDFLNFQSVTDDPGRLELLIPKLKPRKAHSVLKSTDLN